MSEDYAEYGHENIRIGGKDPMRIIQNFKVTSIEKLSTDAEVTLLSDGSIPRGLITLSVPPLVAAAFHLDQTFTLMLTETVDLGVKE